MIRTLLAPRCRRAALALALSLGATNAHGAGPLRVENGRVEGAIARTTLAGALAALRQAGAGFEYRVAPELADEPVAAEFSGEPLGQGLRRLLERFSYYTVGPAGRISRLRVTSLRGDAPLLPPARAEVAAPGPRIEEVLLYGGRSLDEATEAERRFIEGIGEGEPPDEAHMADFYPEQPPGSEWTGPAGEADAGTPAQLPPSDPVVNLEGPPAPPGADRGPLPEFEPTVLEGDIGPESAPTPR